MLVVLDTNVLLSAFLWPGKTSKLIPLLENGTIIPCFSEETVEELKKVLFRQKFKVRLEKMDLPVEIILRTLKKKSEIFKLPKTETVLVKVDPADDKFLLLARVSKAKYLVSGDKHLLRLKKFDSTKIVTVSKFLKFFT